MSIRICGHMHMLKDFTVQEDVRRTLEGTGFEHYLDIDNLVSHSSVLVEVLMSLYDSDSGCFQIRGRNFYFSLVDVLYIMGFPIVGKPICGKKNKIADMSLLHFDNFRGIALDVDMTKGWDLKCLRKVALSEQLSVEMRTKATVLFLIGAVLLPDSSGDSVKSIYCSFLNEIENLKDYAWGSGAHALLHSSLSGRTKNISGCAFAIMIFAFSHIPELVRYLGFTEPSPPPSFPLIKGWIKALDKPSRSGHRRITKDMLRTFLTEQLDINLIVWNPYQDLYQLPDNVFPRLYKNQMVVGRSCIYSFHLWNRVLNATFNAAQQQFGMLEVEIEEMRVKFQNTQLVGKEKRLQGPGERDYDELWKADILTTEIEVRELMQNQNETQNENQNQNQNEREVNSPTEEDLEHTPSPRNPMFTEEIRGNTPSRSPMEEQPMLMQQIVICPQSTPAAASQEAILRPEICQSPPAAASQVAADNNPIASTSGDNTSNVETLPHKKKKPRMEVTPHTAHTLGPRSRSRPNWYSPQDPAMEKKKEKQEKIRKNKKRKLAKSKK